MLYDSDWENVWSLYNDSDKCVCLWNNDSANNIPTLRNDDVITKAKTVKKCAAYVN